MAKARCPVCLPGLPGPLAGDFEAPDDRALFGKIADHLVKIHGAGPAEAFEAAGDALPHVWAEYQREHGVSR